MMSHPSRSFGEIERLAARTLVSTNLSATERTDLEEILHIARRGRDLPSGDAPHGDLMPMSEQVHHDVSDPDL